MNGGIGRRWNRARVISWPSATACVGAAPHVVRDLGADALVVVEAVRRASTSSTWAASRHDPCSWTSRSIVVHLLAV